MINWYHLSTKHMRSLILIIAMSNYPMKLMAGKMIEMSLATFTGVSIRKSNSRYQKLNLINLYLI